MLLFYIVVLFFIDCLFNIVIFVCCLYLLNKLVENKGIIYVNKEEIIFYYVFIKRIVFLMNYFEFKLNEN